MTCRLRLIGLLAMASACGSADPEPRPCTPGVSVSCGCAGAQTGARLCSSEGALGDCVCTPNEPAPAVPAPPVPGQNESCAGAAGPGPHAPHEHVRRALGEAAQALVAACAAADAPVDAASIGVAFGACFAQVRGSVGTFEACDSTGRCCSVGVSTLVGAPGDGEGSWVVLRTPMSIDDYTDHVYWLPPDGSRVERMCAWAPYMNEGCQVPGDLLGAEGCEMAPRQWAEIGLPVRRFLCNPPIP